ncbi:MAG TPA: hypothetical protein VGM63_05115 [Mucilaginibacter sp.]|jgi:hypothetical protein
MTGNYPQNLYAKTEWARYYAEYAQAVEVMLEKPNAKQQPLLTLPLLHSMRHVLQMTFKTHLLLLKNMLGETQATMPPAVSNHTLQSLHQEYSQQLRLVLRSKPIKAATRDTCIQNDQCLTGFYASFEWLDSNAWGFLYPVQLDGITKSFHQTAVINFSDLVPVYNFTLTVLKDTTARLLDRTNWNSGVVRKADFQKVRRAI